jgi:hypothetical protein
MGIFKKNDPPPAKPAPKPHCDTQETLLAVQRAKEAKEAK